jgi:hypothetical protein
MAWATTVLTGQEFMASATVGMAAFMGQAITAPMVVAFMARVTTADIAAASMVEVTTVDIGVVCIVGPATGIVGLSIEATDGEISCGAEGVARTT